MPGKAGARKERIRDHMIKIAKDFYVDIKDVKKWSTQEIYNIINAKRKNTDIYFTVQYNDDAKEVQAEIGYLVTDEVEQDAIYGMYQRLVALSAPNIGLISNGEPGELVTTPAQVARMLRRRNVDAVARALDVLIEAKAIRVLDTGEYYLVGVPKMVLGKNHTDGKGRQKNWDDVNKTAEHSEYVRRKQLEKKLVAPSVVASVNTAGYVCDDDDLPYPGPAVPQAGGDRL